MNYFDYSFAVWHTLADDRKLSSEETDDLFNKNHSLIVSAFHNGMSPAQAAELVLGEEKREKHEPGSRWSEQLQVSFEGDADPNDRWAKEFENHPVWDFFDAITDSLMPREAFKCVPERYKEAFKDYCASYRLERPDNA